MKKQFNKSKDIHVSWINFILIIFGIAGILLSVNRLYPEGMTFLVIAFAVSPAVFGFGEKKIIIGKNKK